MKTRPFTCLEILEDRIAPAGLVDVNYNEATGELILTGDLLANEVNLFTVGPNLHRIEGVGTDIGTVGTTFMDIGKLKKVTLNGGDDADTFRLTLLPLKDALSGLTISGGDGDDLFILDNVVVKGALEIHGDGGADTVVLGGLSTTVTGSLTIDSGATGADGISVSLEALQTRIGGMVDFTGGGAPSFLEATGNGRITIGKGVKFTSGTGDADLDISTLGAASIGKLPTGESILFSGGAGDDLISFNGIDLKLAGGIRLTGGGSGDDGVSLFNPTGRVQIGKLKSGASVLLDGGDDDDFIDMVALTQKLAGGIDFIGGDGVNDLLMGANGGTITVGKLPTRESIRFTGGADENTLFFLSASVTLTGGIDMSSTAGSNTILINSAGGGSGKVKVGKLAGGQSIKLMGGDGDDTLDAGLASLTLAGGIEFAAGNGSNVINLGNPDTVLTIGKLKSGQSILYTGGTGADGIVLDSARVTLVGGIEFTDGGGLNGLEMDIFGTALIGKLPSGEAVKITGSGDAGFAVELAGIVAMKGSLEVTSGTSDTTVSLEGAVVIAKGKSGSALLLNGGDGVDGIELNGSVILGGGLKFVGGDEADHLEASGADVLSIAGGLEFDGGDGDNSVALVTQVLTVGGDIDISGGAGTDSVLLQGLGIVKGNTKIDLGDSAAGVQQISLICPPAQAGALAIGGSLTVNSSSSAGSDDSLEMTKVFVARAVDITMGSGSSAVTIDNFVTFDTFTLRTGDGDDVVDIERRNLFAGSLIGKLATILMGAGDDQLAIGSPTPAVVAPYPDHTRVAFRGDLIVDGGGQANDDRNDIAAQNDVGGVADIDGFNLMTIV